jgi:ribosome-binding protein aMBF1 (putative translation factor)
MPTNLSPDARRRARLHAELRVLLRELHAAKHREIANGAAFRVRQLRSMFYESTAQMARTLKISPSRLSKYQNGDRLLDVCVAEKLVERHGIKLDWLYYMDPNAS